MLVAVHAALELFQRRDAAAGVVGFAQQLLLRLVRRGELTLAALEFHCKAALDVLKTRDGFFRVAQERLCFARVGIEFLLVFERRLTFALRGGKACAGRFGRALRRRAADLPVGLARGQLRELRGHFAAPFTGLRRLALQRLELRGQFFGPRAELGRFFLACLGLGSGALFLLRDTLAAEFERGALVFKVLPRGLVVADVVVQNGDLRVRPRDLLRDGADLAVQAVGIHDDALDLLARRGGFLLQRVDLLCHRRVIGLGDLHLARGLAHGVSRALDGVHPERDFQLLAPRGELEEAVCLLAFFFQRADARFQFSQNVAQAHEVVLRAREPALGLILPVAVLGDAGRLFKNLAALGRLRADDLRDAALSDDGVAVAADSGVEEQLVHVAQTHVLAVDGVLAVAGAVIFTSDHHFVGFEVEAVVGVVNGELHAGEAHGAALLRAAENDVLHFSAAAQLLGARLTEHPADGVRDVALAASVGADNGRDALVDGDLRAVGERFEALDFQCLQEHCFTSSFLGVSSPSATALRGRRFAPPASWNGPRRGRCSSN